MQSLSVYLIVFMGAGCGGTLRHGVNVAAMRLLGPNFPYGTITVNILGSLIMGLLVGWFAHKHDPGQSWRLFMTTGLLGGFTTFSTFFLDTAVIFERGETMTAALYVFSSVGIGIAALFLGMYLVRHFA